ncbi:MAG: hypothetical protein LBQ30_04325 [Treponema sp.]|nr:hypothetical protein [Treponema sp.]
MFADNSFFVPWGKGVVSLFAAECMEKSYFFFFFLLIIKKMAVVFINPDIIFYLTPLKEIQIHLKLNRNTKSIIGVRSAERCSIPGFF